MKYDTGLLTVERANIDVDDDVKLALNGTVHLGDKISTEMKLNAEKLDLGSLSKYVPENYFKEYGIRNFSGMLMQLKQNFRNNYRFNYASYKC